MIHLGDVSSWAALEVGEMVPYASDRPRLVVVDVNTSAPAAIYIDIDHGSDNSYPQLLALVTGYETLKFAVGGSFALFHKSPDADVYIKTADGAKVVRENMAPETFTSLHERRSEDPAVTELRAIMLLNERKRDEQLQAQLKRMEERLGTGSGSVETPPASGNVSEDAPPPVVETPPAGAEGDGQQDGT